MIKCKDSVRFAIIRLEMWSQWEKIYAIFHKYGYPVIFTCGTENHAEDDPHTNGWAYDIRSKHIARNETKMVILDDLKEALGPVYTVILENMGQDNEHYHWQVRRDIWRTL